MTAAPVATAERPRTDAGFTRYELEHWRSRYGVVAGITGRDAAEPLGLDRWPRSPDERDWQRFLRLADGGCTGIVLGRQVHGVQIRHHREPLSGGALYQDTDGHLTTRAGILLGILVADCVPVYLLEPRSGAVGLLHAGWRGTAAGIIERGVERLSAAAGVDPADVVMHCGVSICGDCYEVGPEVLEAVSGDRADGPAPLDLRRALVDRARSAGVSAITVSSWCTAHDHDRFHSHRASSGDPGRMLAYLGRSVT